MPISSDVEIQIALSDISKFNANWARYRMLVDTTIVHRARTPLEIPMFSDVEGAIVLMDI